MSNNDEKVLEKILRELQDIKVVLHEHCSEEDIKKLDNYLTDNN